MEANQQFCLKWNNYHVNIASSFDALRVDEDFVDVTLACDGFQMKAHRMVLSACSPFFRQLLKSNPHPHPIVILRDVSQCNLELLLDFMYHGQVNVAQEQLPEFLKVAELLKVKGLADDKRTESTTPSNGQSAAATPPASVASPAAAPAPPADEPPPVKRPRPPALLTALAPSSPAAAQYDPSAVKRETVECESSDYPVTDRGGDERLSMPSSQASLTGDEGSMMPQAEVSIEEADLSLPAEASRGHHVVAPGPSVSGYESGADPLSRMLTCPHCPHLSSNYGKLKAHIGKVHFPVPVNCVDCGKICKNKYALQVHKMRLLAAADQQAGAGITLPSGVTLSALGAPPPPSPRPLTDRTDRRCFPCFICGKEFGYPHHMRRHVETVHTMFPSYVFCPECGRIYKNKNSLSVHMSMYHNSHRRAAQREQALKAQAAAQAAAGAWQTDMKPQLQQAVSLPQDAGQPVAQAAWQAELNTPPQMAAPGGWQPEATMLTSTQVWPTE